VSGFGLAPGRADLIFKATPAYPTVRTREIGAMVTRPPLGPEPGAVPGSSLGRVADRERG